MKTSIIEAEEPKRYHIAIPILDVVLHDKSVSHPVNLLLAFLATADFESVAINYKI